MGRWVSDFLGGDGCRWGRGCAEVGGTCLEELGGYWEYDGVPGGILGVVSGVLMRNWD